VGLLITTAIIWGMDKASEALLSVLYGILGK
jgi:hypothetical protein